MELKIDYNQQMLNRYPEVIKAIREFQIMIKTQSLEIEEMHEELTKILANAYVASADETRIEQWEQALGIFPLEQGEDSLETWLEDRRETILARLYKPEKLNTKTISNVVKIFTGGEATSYFKNSTIYVLITPPKGNKQYKFENIEQELSKKTPAHLLLHISRNYVTWGDVKAKYSTWGDVKGDCAEWNEVLYSVYIDE